MLTTIRNSALRFVTKRLSRPSLWAGLPDGRSMASGFNRLSELMRRPSPWDKDYVAPGKLNTSGDRLSTIDGKIKSALSIVESPHMKLQFLKVKIKSLASEAGIIRKEENQIADYNDPIRASLRRHRDFDVAGEMRCSLLAYGFLRGRRYRSMELTTRRPPDWKKVREIASRFGETKITGEDNRFKAWAEEPEPTEEIAKLREAAIAAKEARRQAWADKTLADGAPFPAS